jgi:hypothetical protein
METVWRDAQPRTIYTPGRFIPAVYQEIVSGKPRMSSGRASVEISAPAELRLEQRSR